VSPAGSLKGNPIRIGKIDRPHQTVIDNLSDLAVVLQETLTQLEQFCLMGQVKRDMIELYGPLIRYTCGFSESIDLMASIFKERDRRSLTYVKEVVPEHLRAYSSHEGSPEYAMPEARRAIQVISNEGKVIQPRPRYWHLIHQMLSFARRLCVVSHNTPSAPLYTIP
jgi:hypothetical protein